MELCELELRTNPGLMPGPMVQDLGTAPAFASYPEADKTVYLDFNGHTTTGTAWNNSSRPSIYTPPYNTDGSASYFSVAEQIAIREIFNSVAEDFAPFTINVTTIEPDPEDLVKNGIGDTRWGVRVCIGGSHADWWGAANSGVAFTQSFHAGMPAFVFAETLSYQTQWIAETVSHEVGHTLGLSHDGAVGNPYYLGHGTGPTGWAPIMGGSFYKTVTQWDRGEFPGATNTQDDLAIITNPFWNGVSYRPDDYPVPTLLGVDVTRGIIEQNTDVDVFILKPQWSGGKPGSRRIETRIMIDPAPFVANLDVKAQLYDSSGNLVWDSSPIDALNVDFSLVLRTGFAYALHVSGDGSENYSNYGSLGQYTITVVTP